MSAMGLTPRLHATLLCIEALERQHARFPLLNEIAAGIGIHAKSRVHRALKALIERSRVIRTGTGSYAVAPGPEAIQPQKARPMTIEGFNPYEGGFVEIPVSVLVSGIKNGWSTADMVAEYDRFGTHVRESDIANALSQHSNEVHADRRAA